MEKYVSSASSVSSVGWNFHTFLKHFVPGVFAAFWVILYAIRLAHPLGSPEPIATDAQLLTFLHKTWAETIGMVLALGSFVGFVLSGVDPIIRAFMGSRILNLVFKYLLSSKSINFAYFQFMRLHDVSYRYERLPKYLIQRLGSDLREFEYVKDDKGDYARKYFFRETVQSYFWNRCLTKEDRTELDKEWDQASLFVYLSFVSLLLLVFQSFFYIEHLMSPSATQVSLLWLKSYVPPILFDWFSGFSILDLVPLVLTGYMLVNLIYNVYRRLIYPDEKPATKRGSRLPKRLAMQTVALVGYLAFCAAFHSKIRSLTWLEPTDIFLFSVSFLTFVAFYWSGTFHFSRFTITFEHLFSKHELEIMGFVRGNSDLIRQMDKALGRTPDTEKADGSRNPTSIQNTALCRNCSTISAVTYYCQKCGIVLCYPCAAHERLKCPTCGIELLRKATP